MNTKNLHIPIFVAILLFSFHYFFIYFIASTYLTNYFSDKVVGVLYTLAAILNITFFLLIPKYLRKKGNYRLTLWLTSLEIVALIGLVTTSNPWLIAPLFILHGGVNSVILYCLDIFLEKHTPVQDTGSIRGTYLTIFNIPPIITPFIAGTILDNSGGYWKVFLIALVFLIPFIILLISNLRNFEDPHYPKLDVKETFKQFVGNKNIYDVFIDHFLLSLFYGWMVVYMPIYLYKYIGFNWEELGVMFSIMLLPFVLFQIPIGNLEDKKHYEKPVLIFGFIIMAFSTFLIPFINEKSFVLWTAILFITRIGASLVEVSSESYFFKHVKSENAGFISFFRLTKAIPFLIIPLIMGLALMVMDLKYTFIILSVLMLFGVRYTLNMDGKKSKQV